jgi:hypothetical protein
MSRCISSGAAETITADQAVPVWSAVISIWRFFECELCAAMFANTFEALRHVIDFGPPSCLGGDVVEIGFLHTPACIADDVNGTPAFRQSGEGPRRGRLLRGHDPRFKSVP